MKEHQDPKKLQKTPPFAPGMTDEAIEADADSEEIRRGEYTPVTKLEWKRDLD